MIEFLVACLATWRIAAALYYEHGPWDMWVKLREKADQSPFWSKQLNCFWCCTSIAAIITFLLYLVAPILLYPVAFSGAAVLLTHGGRIVQKEMIDHEH